MKRYNLGNCLRGYFQGSFDDIEAAWRVLSYRFLQSFPSKSGRGVQMYVWEKNSYGLDQEVLCRDGITSLESATADEMAAYGCKLY